MSHSPSDEYNKAQQRMREVYSELLKDGIDALAISAAMFHIGGFIVGHVLPEYAVEDAVNEASELIMKDAKFANAKRKAA